MRKILLVALGMFVALSLGLWVSGLLRISLASWMPARRAEAAGLIMLFIACLGALAMWLGRWIIQRRALTKAHVIRKYGLE